MKYDTKKLSFGKCETSTIQEEHPSWRQKEVNIYWDEKCVGEIRRNETCGKWSDWYFSILEHSDSDEPFLVWDYYKTLTATKEGVRKILFADDLRELGLDDNNIKRVERLRRGENYETGYDENQYWSDEDDGGNYS